MLAGEVQAVRVLACRWFPTFWTGNLTMPKPVSAPTRMTRPASWSPCCGRRRQQVPRPCRVRRCGPITAHWWHWQRRLVDRCRSCDLDVTRDPWHPPRCSHTVTFSYHKQDPANGPRNRSAYSLDVLRKIFLKLWYIFRKFAPVYFSCGNLWHKLASIKAFETLKVTGSL